MAEQVKDFVKAVKDKERFEEYLESAGDKLVVVDFYADWCGPCKMIAPTVEKMAKKLKDTVIFFKVNVDDCDSIAEDEGVEAMPTFKFFKNGKKVDDFVGANVSKLEEKIKAIVGEQAKS